MDLSQYKLTLTEEQNRLLLAVETGNLRLTTKSTENLMNNGAELFRDKDLDYISLKMSLQKGRKKIIEFLLSKGCRAKTPTDTTKFQHSALYYAIQIRDIKIFKELYQRGASIFDDETDIPSTLELAMKSIETLMFDFILDEFIYSERLKTLPPDSPASAAFLLASCWADNSEALNIFVSRKFPLNVRSCFEEKEWKGFTPLHFALVALSQKALDVLLRGNADFYAQDHNGETPVHIAFRLNEGKDFINNGVLRRYISQCDPMKLENPTDRNGFSVFMILCCVKFGDRDRKLRTQHLNILKSFINGGVDVNESISANDRKFPEYTALHLAAWHYCTETLQLLIDSGADVLREVHDGPTPLKMILHHKNFDGERDLDVLESLVAHGARFDRCDFHLLEWNGGGPSVAAVIEKSWEQDPFDPTVIEALKCGSECRCSDNYVSLHKVLKLSEITSSILVKHLTTYWDLDVNRVLCCGYTALHIAVSKGYRFVIKALLDAGADINIEDRRGYSALHYVLEGVKAGSAKQPDFSYHPPWDGRLDIFKLYILDVDENMIYEFVKLMLKHIKKLLELNQHVSEAIRSDFEQLLYYFPDKRYKWKHLLRNGTRE